MSKKTVPFKMPPNATPPVDLDRWVANRNGSDAAPAEAPPPAPVADAAAEAMKRFTIDVPETLHRRVKAQCAGRGVKMADVIRDLLEREFPDGVGAR